MEAVNYSNLRKNLKTYLDKVSEDYEALVVTRKDDKNVVIISADEYNNMMENMHLLGNDTNRRRLLESKKQLEEGRVVTHSLLEEEE